MTLGWYICMGLWLVFMLIWGFFALKGQWHKALPFPIFALICALASFAFIKY